MQATEPIIKRKYIIEVSFINGWPKHKETIDIIPKKNNAGISVNASAVIQRVKYIEILPIGIEPYKSAFRLLCKYENTLMVYIIVNTIVR